MSTLTDNRLANLRMIVERDGLASAARRFEKPDRQLNDMLAGRKSFGEKVARAMEESYDPSRSPGFEPAAPIFESRCVQGVSFHAAASMLALRLSARNPQPVARRNCLPPKSAAGEVSHKYSPFGVDFKFTIWCNPLHQHKTTESEMNPKTYSNGAEQVTAESITSTGTHIGANLRIEDGFFSFESGFLDAPDLVCSGSTRSSVIRGTTPATVPGITLRH